MTVAEPSPTLDHPHSSSDRPRSAWATRPTSTSSSTTSGDAARARSPPMPAVAAPVPQSVSDVIAGFVDQAVERRPRRTRASGRCAGTQRLRRVEGHVLGRHGSRVGSPPSSATTNGSAVDLAADQLHAEILNRAATSAASSHSATRPRTSTHRTCSPHHGIPGRRGGRCEPVPPRDRRRAHPGGLVLRYRVRHRRRGLSGQEGTFTICSLWARVGPALVGETERAHALFEKLLSFAGPLMLYAEEIDAATGSAPRQLSAGIRAPPRSSTHASSHRERSHRGTVTVAKQRSAGELRQMLVPLALAQFICSFAAPT